MSRQLFKIDPPLFLLLDFLNSACEHDGDERILSKRVYRAAEIRGEIAALCNALTIYYQLSKQYYVKRHMTFSRFITVVRQLCRLYNLPCTSSILYGSSQYEIYYKINTHHVPIQSSVAHS